MLGGNQAAKFFPTFYETLFFFFFAVMHDLHVIHTDLKLENILLVSLDYVKVSDYKVLLFLLASSIACPCIVKCTFVINSFSANYLFLTMFCLVCYSQSSSWSPKDSSYFKRVPKSSAIKVIDIGSTTYERQDQTYIVSTRHYRAPEVILGKFYSFPSYTSFLIILSGE